MRNSYINTLLLAVVTAAVAGAGYYLTEVRQQREFDRIEHIREVARLQRAKVEKLLAAKDTSAYRARRSIRRWRARYKFIPTEMRTPDIVHYLEGLTAQGFETFNISLARQQDTPDFSYYTFDVEGTAYFKSLYHFIWHIENNREFYRLNKLRLSHTYVFKKNPATGIKRRLNMVNFSMSLDAYFNGTDGLSAAEDELLPVPQRLLPHHYPAHNSFYPLVRTSLPPNDEQLVNVEQAELVSVLGAKAVFDDKNGQHILREGDAVYLGTLVKVDPVNSTVHARLNKAGIIENVEIELDTGTERYRQAAGDSIRLSPTTDEN